MSTSTLSLTDADRNELVRCEAVYVNSLEHLTLLRQAGLPEDCVLRTAAPGLAAAIGNGVDRLGNDLTPDIILGWLEAFDAMSQDLFTELRDKGTSLPKGLALSAAKALWRGQRTVYDALLLREEDETRAICVPHVQGTTAVLTQKLDFQWHRLLAGKDGLVVPAITVDANSLPFITPPNASWATRFFFSDPGALFFRLQLSIDRLDSLRRWSGTLFCQRDPDLLKDAGFALLKAGVRIRALDSIKPDATQPEDATVVQEVGSAAERILAPVLAELPSERVRASARDLIAAEVRSTSADYLRLHRAAAVKVTSLTKGSTGFASSTIASPRDIALASAFQEAGHPVATFSHGATRRISANHDRNFILHEDVVSDVYFTFAEDEDPGEEANGVARCDHVVVGAPRFYRRKPINRFLTKPEGVWYVSSGLYMGAGDLLHRAMSDHAQCRFETGIVTDVLAQCGKKVTFKPYPTFRYLDTDPVIDAARKSGITVFEEPVDLRYAIHKPALLITSRSGSTIGYCLCQDKPMIYIEAPGRALREDIRPAFDDAVFLFNADDAGFTEALRDFLSRPMTEIEDLWRSKAQARRHLVDRYIGARISDGSAKLAERLADIIHTYSERAGK